MAIFGVSRPLHRKFSFTVEIPGVGWAGFMACSGLEMEVAEIEHWEGGSLVADKTPGRVKVSDVTLTQGASADYDLWNWFQQVVDADAMVAEPDHQRSVDVVQYPRGKGLGTANGSEIERWTLNRAWPKKFTAGEWDNNADDNVIRTLVLSVRYITKGGDNPA